MRQRRVTLFLVVLGLLTLVALALTDIPCSYRVVALVSAAIACTPSETGAVAVPAKADAVPRTPVGMSRDESGAAETGVQSMLLWPKAMQYSGAAAAMLGASSSAASVTRGERRRTGIGLSSQTPSCCDREERVNGFETPLV